MRYDEFDQGGFRLGLDGIKMIGYNSKTSSGSNK